MRLPRHSNGQIDFLSLVESIMIPLYLVGIPTMVLVFALWKVLS